MTRHNAISALAILPILVASFAQGIQGQTATNEAGGEKAPPIIACSLTSKDMGARVDKLKTELLDEVLRSEELKTATPCGSPSLPADSSVSPSSSSSRASAALFSTSRFGWKPAQRRSH